MSDLVNNAKKILEQEGLNMSDDLTAMEKIEKYLIPAMQNSKDTLEVLYDYKPREKSGFIGKIKNLIINKVKNISLATIEKQAIRQQKYNDLVFQVLENLKKEVESMKNSKEVSK